MVVHVHAEISSWYAVGGYDALSKMLENFTDGCGKDCLWNRNEERAMDTMIA
jgi:hypothetical protein